MLPDKTTLVKEAWKQAAEIARLKKIEWQAQALVDKLFSLHDCSGKGASVDDDLDDLIDALAAKEAQE